MENLAFKETLSSARHHFVFLVLYAYVFMSVSCGFVTLHVASVYMIYYLQDFLAIL